MKNLNEEKNDKLASAFEKFGINELKSTDRNALIGGGRTTGTTSTNSGCTSGDVGCCDSDTRNLNDSRGSDGKITFGTDSGGGVE